MNIAISPSGNFYGSEQTLLIYLKNSSLEFVVCMPRGTRNEQLKAFGELNNVKIELFRNPVTLYVRIFLRSLRLSIVGRNLNLYLNEAGHFRYFRLLPLLGTSNNVIHVRMLEDVVKRSWKSEDGVRLKVLATSEFIQDELFRLGVKSELLSSPFRSFYPETIPMQTVWRDFVIVSRLCSGKGLKYYERFCEYLENEHIAVKIRHYGEMDENGSQFFTKTKNFKYVNWVSMGFVDDKRQIFINGTVLHLNPEEALGAILLEAVEAGLPFLTFSDGGTGEVSRKLKLQEFAFSSKMEDWEEAMVRSWKGWEFSFLANLLNQARIELDRHYSPVVYSSKLDAIVSNDKIYS